MKFSCELFPPDRFLISIRTPQTMPGTLHRLTAAIYAAGLDIVSGQVHTDQEDGEPMTSDTFIVRKTRDDVNPAVDLALIMESVLGHSTPVAEIFAQRGVLEVDPESFAGCEVAFQTEPEATRMYLVTLDRHGLLYWLTGTLARHEINILNGHIDTRGAEVSDDFYLQYAGRALSEEKLQALSRDLHARIKYIT